MQLFCDLWDQTFQLQHTVHTFGVNSDRKFETPIGNYNQQEVTKRNGQWKNV